MKIELVKKENGFVIGYKMIAETPEDTPIIEQIRDMYFWGYKEYGVDYDGRKSAEDENDTTIELSWLLRHFKKEKRKKKEEENRKFFQDLYSKKNKI